MGERHVDKLDRNHAQLLIVDIQEKLLPKIHGHEDVVVSAVKMVKAARVLELPVTLSEQYVSGLGPTIPAVAEAAGDAPRHEKMTFSFCADEECRKRIVEIMRPQVLLIGIEGHVCVQQTALDLLGAQMTPVVLADAVGSRHVNDCAVALERLRSAGAVVTTIESAIFELAHEAGTDLFKKLLPLVK